MKALTYLIWVMALVLAVGFTLINAESVPLNYYFQATTVPLSLLLVCAFAVGGFLGVLSCCALALRYRKRLIALKRQLKKAESQQVSQLHE